MKKFIGFIKTTALGGLTLILPLAVIIFILSYVVNGLVKLNNALVAHLPYKIFDNTAVILGIAICSIILVCFLAGLLLQTGFGKRLSDKLDQFLVDKVPMYGLLKNITQRFTGVDVLALTPAEVDLFGSEARSLAFVIEALPGNRYAVFVPSSPALTIGQLFILPASCVHMLDKSVKLAIDAISQWGSGTKDLYMDEPVTDTAEQPGTSTTNAGMHTS